MKALVVDDDATCRKVLKSFLAPLGEVEVVNGVTAALDRIDAAAKAGTPFNVAFVDLMMPEVDGYDLLSQIRTNEEAKHSDALKVVVTSALSHPKFLKGIEASDGYIAKPLAKQDVVAQLKKLGLI